MIEEVTDKDVLDFAYDVLKTHTTGAEHGFIMARADDYRQVEMVSSGSDKVILNAIAMFLTGLIQDGNEKGEVIWMLSDMINARLEEGEKE